MKHICPMSNYLAVNNLFFFGRIAVNNLFGLSKLFFGNLFYLHFSYGLVIRLWNFINQNKYFFCATNDYIKLNRMTFSMMEKVDGRVLSSVD